MRSPATELSELSIEYQNHALTSDELSSWTTTVVELLDEEGDPPARLAAKARAGAEDAPNLAAMA